METFISPNAVKISYEIFGDSKSNEALLFFHGFPGSHLQGAFLDKKLKDQKIAMVAVDRPGYGNSSWVNPKDWKFVAQAYGDLMTSLGFDKMTVMAVSGGAPMAHMTSNLLHHRVKQLIVICGLASFSSENRSTFSNNQKRLLDLSKLIPTSWLKLILNKGMSSFRPEKRIQHLIQTLHETDREVLTAPQNQDLLLQSMKWARNQGSNGVVWDSQIFCQDWLGKFCIKDKFNKFQTLYFHGEMDYLLNPKMSQMMKESVPRSAVKIVEKQGHYSLPLMEQKTIFEVISGVSQ